MILLSPSNIRILRPELLTSVIGKEGWPAADLER